MAYPPPIPPTNRSDSTISADNHARDHNQLAAAARDIVAALGANPAGGYSNLTERLLGITGGASPEAVAAFTKAVADAQAARVAAEAAAQDAADRVVEDLGTTDAQTKALIEAPGSLTQAALFASIAAGVTQPIDPDATGWDIIPILGQSNLLGRGVGLDLDYLDGPDSRVYQFANLSSPYPDQVVIAREPLFHQELPSSTVGFPLTFAKHYANTIPTNRRVLLVPCARGNTGFGSTGAYTWRVGATGADVNLYDLAVAQINKALALPGQNRVTAVLWHQGEANNGSSANGYRTDLLAVIDDLRSRYGADVPFVLGQMSPQKIAESSGYATIDGVHKEMPTLRPHVGMWLAAPLYNPGDPVHFSGDGQRVNGRTAFDAYALALTEPGGIAPRRPLPAPAQVKGLTSSAATQTAISLSWAAAPLAQRYRVRYRVQGAGAWVDAPDATGTTASVTSLAGGTTYEFAVAAVGPDATGPFSATLTKATASAPVPGFVDTFSRPDGPLGVAESGQTWQITGQGSGNTSHSWRVESERARMTQGQANMFATIDGLASDGTLTHVVGSVGAGHVGGVVLRYVDPDNYLLLQWRQSSSSLRPRLTKRLAGSPSDIAAAAAGIEIADGDALETVMAGSSLTVKRNGITIITGTSTDFVSATRHGLFAQNADMTGSVDSISFVPA